MDYFERDKEDKLSYAVYSVRGNLNSLFWKKGMQYFDGMEINKNTLDIKEEKRGRMTEKTHI